MAQLPSHWVFLLLREKGTMDTMAGLRTQEELLTDTSCLHRPLLIPVETKDSENAPISNNYFTGN